MTASEEDVRAGQAVYTRRGLRLYDFIVHGLSNRFVWRCPTQGLVAHYNRHVTANHLDVGVGTGYFLERCRFPPGAPRIALLDINRNSLDFAAGRIARHRPETYLRNGSSNPSPSTRRPSTRSASTTFSTVCPEPSAPRPSRWTI